MKLINFYWISFQMYCPKNKNELKSEIYSMKCQKKKIQFTI
jgi:hypothetical protein